MHNARLTSLVIDSRKLVRMKMDGPALNVVMEGRSPVLFPLRRLARIHILGIPKNDIEVLILCAEQQVPIAFFHFNGRLRCRLHPAEGVSSLVDHWFEHVEFDAQIAQVYKDWLLHQGLYVMSRLGINNGAFHARQQLLNEALHRHCRLKLGKKKMQAALDWLHGLLRFHLEHIIESFGFSQPRGKQKLLSDMMPIGELLLLYALATHLAQEEKFNITPQRMTDFYQQQSTDLEFVQRRMLVQLVHRLEAVI